MIEPHGTRSNWRVNAQPSTGPSAGRVSPDPELHHPDLGNARQHAAQQAAETPASPANIIPAEMPSPRPGVDSPAHFGHDQGPPRSPDAIPAIIIPQGTPPPVPRNATPGLNRPAPAEHQERWQLPGHPLPDLLFPLSISEHMPPMGRDESQNAWMPRRLPERPHSPSNAYVPGLNSDRAAETRLRGMVDHSFTNLERHPAMPAGPTGEITLGREHSDALIAFRNQVLAQPDHSRQYAQTYRIENGGFVPNHPSLIAGRRAEVAMPSGSYPAGTGLVIRSFNADHATGLPGEADLLRAYQDRTNMLHEPDTHVASHILFNPRDDSAFMFDGSLDAQGTPQYFGLALSPQHIAQPAARNPAQGRPEWLDARTPQMPVVPSPADSRMPSVGHASTLPPTPDPAHADIHSETPREEAPAFFFPPRPDSPPRPASAAESPIPQSPPWKDWMDFDPASPKHGDNPGAMP